MDIQRSEVFAVATPLCRPDAPRWAVRTPGFVAAARRVTRDSTYVHYAFVTFEGWFYSNGRSGPRAIDLIIPQGSACSDTMLCHLGHDILAHGVGMSESESNRLYSTCLRHAGLPIWKAKAAKTTLDLTPRWFTREDDTWIRNEPGMRVRSFWTRCARPAHI